MRKSNLIFKAMFSAVSLLLLVSPSAQAKGHEVWHTVQDGADIPWTPFLDIGGEAGYPGVFIDASVAGRQNGELHFVGSSPEGRLWHTVRYPDNYWSPVDDLTDLAGQPGYCSGVGTAFTGDILHVVTESYGRLWHTMRKPNGAWSKFEFVGDRAGLVPREYFIEIAVSGKPDGELHVVAVGSSGKAWHTLRSAAGGWQEFSAVSILAGDPGPYRSVAAAFIGDELHVVAGTDLNGKLWHTIRKGNGDWSKFKDITDEGGYPNVFDDVSIAGDDLTGDLHVVTLFRTIDAAHAFTPRGPWHAILKGADGGWTPFIDVTGEAGTPDCVAAVETALAGQSLHIAALTVPCVE
jgi:hypothetical protein